MSAHQLRGYRFSTDAQWNACLVVQSDRATAPRGTAIRPFAPFERQPRVHATPGAHAPAVTRAGEVVWRDDAGLLHRLSADGEGTAGWPAPAAMAQANRIVASGSSLWVAAPPPDTLQRFEDDSLTRVLTAEVPNARVVDIAGDGAGSVFALVERDGRWQAVRHGPSGKAGTTITLQGVTDAQGLVYLPGSRRLVVLGGARQQRIVWFTADQPEATPLFSLAVAALRPCFQADVLGSGAGDRILLGGADGSALGATPHVVVLDADGNALDHLPLDTRDSPVTGVAGTSERLLVTGRRGLLEFAVARAVPDSAGPVRAVVITPPLFSPDREDQRRWLRVEATSSLPEGSTLEIAVAATDDPAVRDRLAAMASDESMTASQRAGRLLDEPGIWRSRTVFQGNAARASGGTPLSAKLFDVRDRYVWISVVLTASAGARVPGLSALAVLYPGRTLMEHLPSIYQKEEHQPDSYLRALVGVLESTTQGMDARIASMGSQVHPSTAQGPWLDFIAGWTGVPWDDALDVPQKRRIVARAGELAEARGTRAGLEALLECLMPGSPPRYRVTDPTADVGFATVGGGGCPGSTLPAMLGGRTRWNAELGSQSVLGLMRLPCAGQPDDGASQLAGRVRVEVAATAGERARWEPWLLSTITQMVPLTARVELRWVSAHALRSGRLDGTMTLDAPPPPHLGTGAITSLSRLPDRGVTLSDSGPGISRRLR